MKQNKIPQSKPRNWVAKHAIMTGAGRHTVAKKFVRTPKHKGKQYE